MLSVFMKGKKMFGQFTTIPTALYEDERLPRTCLVVYGVLTSHAGSSGRIFPSYDTIAKEARISRRTAIYAMKRLVYYGYVAKQKGTFKGTSKQASNYYYLNPNPSILKISENVDKCESYPQRDATVAPLTGATIAPQTKSDMKKNSARNSDKCNFTIHARAKDFPAGVGEGGWHPSLCVNDNENLGQSGTKKRESAFDAMTTHSFEKNYMQ